MLSVAQRKEFAEGVKKQRAVLSAVRRQAKTLFDKQHKGTELTRNFCSETLLEWGKMLKEAPQCTTKTLPPKMRQAIPMRGRVK